jgi:hypothetical protein
MSATACSSYIRTQAVIAAIVNAVLNPALAWLLNPARRHVPLDGIIVDTAITTMVLSLLVALCVTATVRGDIKAGRVSAMVSTSWIARLLERLPTRAWRLGLLLGLAIAAVWVPLVYGVLRAVSPAGLSFAAFALGKAAYTAGLGFVVTRWVLQRQLLAVR